MNTTPTWSPLADLAVDLAADVAPGAGFFIGDGAGVGKGRQVCGIIIDNIARGRAKHVWCALQPLEGLFFRPFGWRRGRAEGDYAV